jgi:adenylate cyclase
MQRRLTTILAADIAGFSRLVGADEEGTLAAQRAHRAELIDPLLAAHGGRVANTAGDSLLIEFSSTVEAMRFAVAVQAGMRERNVGVPEERRIAYRMGINVGDVVAEGTDLLGDGVNVAARLEALSPPDGIVVSRAVRDQVRDRMALALADLDEVVVKNIARPVRAFQVLWEDERPIRVAPPSRQRWRLPVAAAAALVVTLAGGVVWYLQQPAFEPAQSTRMALAVPEGPSLAVLPFTATVTDGEDVLGRGIAEDIADALTSFTDLTVVASESTADYVGATTPRQVAEDLGVRHVLRGSIERDGERLRINVRLIDAMAGQQVWAERYEADGADILAVRDEVAPSIAAVLGPEETPLATTTINPSRSRETTELGAYELVLVSRELRHRYNKEDHLRALELADRAVALDPTFARAHVERAWANAHAVWNNFTDDPAGTMQQAILSAERAIALDPYYAVGYWVLGSALTCDSDDQARALELYRKALELNPNHPGIMAEWGGYVLPALYPDRAAADGLPLIERAIRLNPRANWYYGGLVSAHFFARQPEAAVRAFASLDYPQFLSRALLAASLGHLGETERARTVIADLLERKPGFSLGTLEQEAELCPKGTSPEGMAYIKEGLARAGLPE